MKYFFYSFGLMFLLVVSCKKETSEPAKPIPTVDTFLTPKNIFFSNPVRIVSQNNVRIQIMQSNPCFPSHEVFFFTAETPTITDSANTSFTWTVEQTTNTILRGRKVQYVFARAGTHKITVEIKTKEVLVEKIEFSVSPLGQLTNNRNVGMQIDPIDNNRPNYLSFSSKAQTPLDGFINATYWDFGDGTNSSQQFIQKEFTAMPVDKEYTVKLFVNNSNGCKDSSIQKVNVPAMYNQACSFTYSQTSACKPSSEEFTFIADTNAFPSTAIYLWDFKNFVFDVPGKVVKHKFTFPNTYDVQLRVMNNGRMISQCNKIVTAKGQDVTPIPVFFASIENADSTRWFFNCTSKFDNGTFLSDIFWDFGDGNSTNRPANDYNARHTYTKQAIAKTYIVKMVVTASSGCKDSSFTQVIVPKW